MPKNSKQRFLKLRRCDSRRTLVNFPPDTDEPKITHTRKVSFEENATNHPMKKSKSSGNSLKRTRSLTKLAFSLPCQSSSFDISSEKALSRWGQFVDVVPPDEFHRNISAYKNNANSIASPLAFAPYQINRANRRSRVPCRSLRMKSRSGLRKASSFKTSHNGKEQTNLKSIPSQPSTQESSLMQLKSALNQMHI